MEFTFSGSDLIVLQNVGLTSAKELTFTDSGQYIQMVGAASFHAHENINISPPISISQPEDVFIISNQSITISSDISTAGLLDIHSNYDCTSSGSVTIEANSIISASELNIRGNNAYI